MIERGGVWVELCKLAEYLGGSGGDQLFVKYITTIECTSKKT